MYKIASVTEISCCLCYNEIAEMKYAIRDWKPETYIQWIIRHVKSFLYFGLSGRKRAIVLPVCKQCFFEISQHSSIGRAGDL